MSHFAMPVRLYMSHPVRSVRSSDSLEHAKRELMEHGISSLAVVDEAGALRGVISRTDLLRAGRREAGTRPGARLLTLPAKPVSELMSMDLVTIGPDEPVGLAAKHMAESRIHRVLVLEDEVLVGVLSPQDIMRAIKDKRVNKPISELMSSPVFTVRASEPLTLATDRLAKAHVSGLIVVDGEWPVGAFTQVEALRAKDDPGSTLVEEAMTSAILSLDATMPIHRAAAQAAQMDARRVVATAGARLVGVVSPLDFARAAV